MFTPLAEAITMTAWKRIPNRSLVTFVMALFVSVQGASCLAWGAGRRTVAVVYDLKSPQIQSVVKYDRVSIRAWWLGVLCIFC